MNHNKRTKFKRDLVQAKAEQTRLKRRIAAAEAASRPPLPRNRAELVEYAARMSSETGRSVESCRRELVNAISKTAPITRQGEGKS